MLLPATDKSYMLSDDIIRLLNQTPQNINAARYEGNDESGRPIFRIVFLNKFSLQTVEAEYFLGKTALEANPNFAENGIYDKLIEVFETGESATITYNIDFLGTTLTIEALIVKMDNFLISYSTDITKYNETNHVITSQYNLFLEAHKVLKMGSWILDLQTKTVSSNFNLGSFFELPTISSTITLDEYYQLLFTDDIEETKKNFQQLISNNQHFKIERRYITAAGNEKYIEITGKPIFENNVCNKLIGTFRDITEARHHELEQAKDELLLEEAKELLLMCTWSFNPETKEAHYSKELSEILEFEVPVVLTSFDAYLQYIHDDDKESAKENFNRTIATSQFNFKADRKIKTVKGNIKYIEIVGKSIVKNGVVKRVFGTIRDITEEKVRLLGLFEQEIKLQEIQQILKLGTWSADIPNNTAFFSTELSEILEYDPPIVFQSYEDYFNHIAPEEQHLSKFNYNRVYNLSEVQYRFERKMISKKGNVKYIELTCQSYQENGKIVRLFGTIKDITERKLKDIKLLESEQLLIEARNLLKMGSVRFDYTNEIYYLSEELSKILELPETRAFYKFEHWWKYVAPEEKEISKKNFEMGKLGAVTEVEKIERKFISALGNEKYVEFIFEPNENTPEKLTGTFRDITEKKQEELRLLQAQKELFEARNLLRMGTWSFDLINQTVYYSKELSEILNYPSPIEFYDFEQFFAHIHADDKNSVRKNYEHITNPNTIQYITHVDRKMVDYWGNVCYLEFNTKVVIENGVKSYVNGTFRDITEKKIKDLLIEESELRLKEAQRLSKMCSWIMDLKNKQIHFSADVKSLFKNYLPHIISFNDYFKINIHDNAAVFEDNFYTLIHQKKQFKTIHHLLFNNGIEYYIEVIGQHSINKNNEEEITGTFRDITEQYKIDEALKASEERYKLLFEHNPTMYLTINERQKIISINQFGLEYLQYTEAELLQHSFTMLYPAEETNKAIRNIELLKQSYTNFWQWEIKKKKKNGDVFWAKETGRIAKNKAGQNIYLIISEDITDEVENRELIKIKQNELLLAKNAAEAAAKEKQQFASIMSHEIRSPLNAVIGITNLLLLEDPKPEQLEELNTLKFAGENLLMLVNDILDFNKIEAGKLQLEKTAINLQSLVKNLHNTFQYKATEKNIQLKNDVDENLPEVIYGDPTRIAQILTNLLSNAIKFTEKGSVELTLRKMKNDNPDFVKIRFEVSDSGIGIPKEKHQLIFESFSQANTDTNRKFGGTGLGLTITKKLIELHKSEIHLQSEVGKGTTFYFDLLLETDKNQNIINAEKNKAPKAKDLVGKRILLVEDNAFNQLVAVKFLEKWEVEVDVADNGLIALNKIENTNYDLILMDIQMPEMNGVECTHVIRKSENESIRNIPIIAFMAAADTEKEKMISEGMNDSISKPFNPAELFNKILQFV